MQGREGTDLGRKLVLMSDFPALTHHVSAVWGPAQGDTVGEAPISKELIFQGVIT